MPLTHIPTRSFLKPDFQKPGLRKLSSLRVGLLTVSLLGMGLYQLAQVPHSRHGIPASTPASISNIGHGGDIQAATQPQELENAIPLHHLSTTVQLHIPATSLMAASTHGAQVLRVIDGDTVAVRVVVWLGQELVTKVRLRGIDAPEINGACPSEIQRAIAARDALVALIDAQPVLLTQVGQDKYGGRVVARLVVASGQDAGAALVAAGHARPWRGRRETGWCSLPAP